jgi:hypothetical protein
MVTAGRTNGEWRLDDSLEGPCNWPMFFDDGLTSILIMADDDQVSVVNVLDRRQGIEYHLFPDPFTKQFVRWTFLIDSDGERIESKSLPMTYDERQAMRKIMDEAIVRNAQKLPDWAAPIWRRSLKLVHYRQS